MSWAKRILVLLAGLFGVLLLASNAWTIFTKTRLLLSGRETIGVVTGQNEEQGAYRSVVSIEAEDGTARIPTRRRYSSKTLFPVGSQVRVLYLAGNPAGGEIRSETERLWEPLIGAILGLLFLAPALLAIKAARDLSARKT